MMGIWMQHRKRKPKSNNRQNVVNRITQVLDEREKREREGEGERETERQRETERERERERDLVFV